MNADVAPQVLDAARDGGRLDENKTLFEHPAVAADAPSCHYGGLHAASDLATVSRDSLACPTAALYGDGCRDGDAYAYAYAHEGRRYTCAHLDAHLDRDADVDIPAHADAHLDIDADADASAYVACAGDRLSPPDFHPLFRSLACGDLAW